MERFRRSETRLIRQIMCDGDVENLVRLVRVDRTVVDVVDVVGLVVERVRPLTVVLGVALAPTGAPSVLGGPTAMSCGNNHGDNHLPACGVKCTPSYRSWMPFNVRVYFPSVDVCALRLVMVACLGRLATTCSSSSLKRSTRAGSSSGHRPPSGRS